MTTKRLTALLLALCMLLSLAACGSSDTASDSGEETTAAEETAETAEEESADAEEETESAEEAEESDDTAISDLVTYQLTANEISSFMILNTQNSLDLGPLMNLYDGLLSTDANGNIVAMLAESWSTDDGGQTWTFVIRDDACWVDYNGEYKADLTSADWITSMEWILNAWKNGATNTSMLTATIEGAQEYYEYTSGLSEEEAMALESDNEVFMDMVGIETPDDYTIVYHCLDATSWFYTLGYSNCLYPFPSGLIEEVGVENVNGITNETMWYSGAYIMTEYVYQNEKVFEPNPLWWGADEIDRFDSVTVKMLESVEVAYQLYQTGEIDNVSLSESNLSIIYSDPDNEYYDYLCETKYNGFSYSIHWNYNKLDEDGVPDEDWNMAAANEAFRLSWYYGLDLTTYWQRTNAINPMNLENNAYTMRELCYTSDGTDYVDLVLENLGFDTSYDSDTPQRLDTELAEDYKQQAIEELTELGVSFPIVVDYYIPASDQTELDTANVLSQIFSDCLGDDYVVLNICTYVSSVLQEVRTPQLESVTFGRWGADYKDPQNYLDQMVYGSDNAYMAIVYNNVDDLYDCEDEWRQDLIAELEEYTALVEEASAINDDLDERYAALAEAETYLIEHALLIPLSYSTSWELTKINDYSADYGTSRYLNWETNVNGYTTEDYEAFKAEAAG